VSKDGQAQGTVQPRKAFQLRAGQCSRVRSAVTLRWVVRCEQVNGRSQRAVIGRKSLAYRATPALWFAMPCDRKQLRGLRMEGADKGCVHSEYYSMG
jgi:hypothetical protein